MFCPVCLTYAQQVEAVAVVAGTQYCAAHSVEALSMMNMQRGPRSQAGFTPPFTPPPAPADPPSA